MAGIVLLRRFGRIFFLLAAGVSLLLCVAAVVAWPVSYWRGFAVARHAGAFYRTFTISRGHFLLQAFGSIASDVNPPGVTWWETAASAPGDLRYIAIGQPIDFRAQTWTFRRLFRLPQVSGRPKRLFVGPGSYPPLVDRHRHRPPAVNGRRVDPAAAGEAAAVIGGALSGLRV
jgi:hypothetical protein